jgi:hypothetical protein
MLMVLLEVLTFKLLGPRAILGRSLKDKKSKIAIMLRYKA